LDIQERDLLQVFLGIKSLACTDAW
jgi:hypothetical protein